MSVADKIKLNAYQIVAERKHFQRLRILLIFCTSITILLTAFVLISSSQEYPSLKIESPWIKDKLVVAVSPTLNGISNDNNPYLIAAQEAEHSIVSSRYINLKLPVSTLQHNNSKAEDIIVKSPQGSLDTENNTIELTGPVVITQGEGFRAELGHAEVYLSESRINATENVTVNFSGYSLISKTAQITQSGDILNFEGNVRVYFPPTIESQE